MIMIFVIFFPIIITIPYSICQHTGLYKYMFLKVTVGDYTRTIILMGIVLASIATVIGIAVLVRFCVVMIKSANVVFELRLLFVVMTSNIGCIGYNIFQLLLNRAYLNKNTQLIWESVDLEIVNEVRLTDQVSKSILIVHHYTSCVLLICMRFE